MHSSSLNEHLLSRNDNSATPPRLNRHAALPQQSIYPTLDINHSDLDADLDSIDDSTYEIAFDPATGRYHRKLKSVVQKEKAQSHSWSWKIAYAFGKLCALAFSVGCIATGIGGLAAVTQIKWIYLTAGMLSGRANWRMTESDVPAVFTSINTIFKSTDGKPLSKINKGLILFGLTTGVSFGFGLFWLVQKSFMSLPATLNLTAGWALASIPYVSWVMAAFTMLNLSALMVSAFASLVKEGALWESTKHVLTNLKTVIKSSLKSMFSSPLAILKTVVKGFCFGLLFLGNALLMMTCASLVPVPGLNIAIGLLGFIANIPFTIKVFNKVCDNLPVIGRAIVNGIKNFPSAMRNIWKSSDEKAMSFIKQSAAQKRALFVKRNFTLEKLQYITYRTYHIVAEVSFGIAAVVNSVVNGLLAITGQPLTLLNLAAAAGGTLNSFSSVVGNSIKSPAQKSTAAVVKSLSFKRAQTQASDRRVEMSHRPSHRSANVSYAADDNLAVPYVAMPGLYSVKQKSTSPKYYLRPELSASMLRHSAASQRARA
jgi:hypothetical protein